MFIDAVLSPPEIDLLPKQDLAGTHCVVFDVLRATSSIITGLAHGVLEIRPVLSIQEALQAHVEWPDSTLGGERFGSRIEGFDLGNSPLEYRRRDIHRVVTTTTNGTVALRACAKADRVFAGALLNMAALITCIRAAAPERLLLVCAGTFRDLAFEDVLAAGMLAAAFPDADLSDAARVAHCVYRQNAGDILGALKESKNGRKLVADGREEDVLFCAQHSLYPVVGSLCEGVIRKPT